MKSYNKVFGGISTHVLYVVAIPLFFFLFMLLYEPFNANEYLSCGRDLFSFNVAMLFAMMLVLNDFLEGTLRNCMIALF